MSLNATLRTATSGMNAAQMGLRAVSDNIANVNTPGYVRKTLDQRPLSVAGQGMGVMVAGTKRVTDQYLALASQMAGGDASRWKAYSQYMDTAQGLFGDPASENFFFNRVDNIFSGFAAAANDPASSLLRSQAIANVKDFLNDAQRINSQLVSLSDTMDTRIGANVAQANDLLTRINALNSDITRARLIEQDASGAENIQAQLVDQLATLIGVRVSPHEGGGVDIRTSDGMQLAGESAVTLIYNSSPGNPGFLTAVSPEGGSPQPVQLEGGEIRGLMDLRNTTLPEMSDQLGEFVQRTVERLNAAHNDSSAVPAPNALSGRNTGLDLPTAVSGFTGQATIGIVNASGVQQHSVTIDFDTNTFSINGSPAGSFTPGSFEADLNAALGGAATATFSNGALKIEAAAGLGVAIDEGTSMKAGRQFSHFFGLNDLVRSNSIGTYDTGMKASDGHGFTPGDTITFRLSQPDGKALRDVTVSIPSGSMADLVAELNNSSTGVGVYGQFSLDGQGRLTFAGSPPTVPMLSVVRDTTSRGPGGPTFTALFGIGASERAGRVGQFKVDNAISADSNKLAFAKFDISGTPSLRAGDARGALGLASAGDMPTSFGAAGGIAATTMTVARYASEFSGSIARQAADAQSRMDASDAVRTEADARRQATESVNLDEELVNLTTYQQAFNASARMIQAAKELFDVLTNMI